MPDKENVLYLNIYFMLSKINDKIEKKYTFSVLESFNNLPCKRIDHFPIMRL